MRVAVSALSHEQTYDGNEGGQLHNKANALGQQKSAARSSLCFLLPVICDVRQEANLMAIYMNSQKRRMYDVYLDEKGGVRTVGDLTRQKIINWVNRNKERLISSTPKGKTKIEFVEIGKDIIKLSGSGGWNVKIEEVIEIDRYIRDQLLLGNVPSRRECWNATGIRNWIYAPQIAYQIRKDV